MNYSKLTVAEKIQKVRTVITLMTGNANFPTPNPKLSDMTTAADDVEIAYDAALDGGKSKKQVLYAAVKEMDGLFTDLGSYVQTTSNGDNLKILSSGFDVKKTPVPVGPLEVPQNVTVTTGTISGTIVVKWKTNKQANGFFLEYCQDPLGGPWTLVNGLTKAKFTIEGLITGKEYWVRVTAFNAAGNTNPSDPAIGRAK